MTTRTLSISDGISIQINRRFIIAVVLILIGLMLFSHATNNLSADITTILRFQPEAEPGPDPLIVQTQSYLTVMGLIYIVTGIINVFRIDNQAINRLGIGLMVFLGILFIPTVLVSAAAGGSTNITTMVAESIRLSTPLAIGACAGIWCERSGVINIAIEGMMLSGACAGFTTMFLLAPTGMELATVHFIAVVMAIMTGGLSALLHAWLSITFRTDQIVSGTVINFLALGITSFIRREVLLSTEAGGAPLQDFAIPILSDLPVVGDAIFTNQPIFFLMFVVVIGTHITLFFTRWGLRTLAVGEHPHAADTLGINVNRTRWINVFVGGLIAGLAGAWFSLEVTASFNDGMTNGNGFIALAAVIFGKWTPFGAFGAALLFGFSDAMQIRLQSIGVEFPVQFLQMVPYVVTIVVLAGFIGRASAPKAIGQPYVKE